jgi:hypothetical protein
LVEQHFDRLLEHVIAVRTPKMPWAGLALCGQLALSAALSPEFLKRIFGGGRHEDKR